MGPTNEQPKYVPLSALADARNRIAELESENALLRSALWPFAEAWRRDPLILRVEDEAIAFDRAATLLKDARR